MKRTTHPQRSASALVPMRVFGEQLADADHGRTPVGRATRATTTVRQAEAADEISEMLHSSGDPVTAATQITTAVRGIR